MVPTVKRNVDIVLLKVPIRLGFSLLNMEEVSLVGDSAKLVC